MPNLRDFGKDKKWHCLVAALAVIAAVGATGCEPLAPPTRQAPTAAPLSITPANAKPASNASTAHPILPPLNPLRNVEPRPQFSALAGHEYQVGQQLPPCWGWARGALIALPTAPDCVSSEVRALDRALSLEGSGPVTLPRDFSSLSIQEQLLVITDLERVARGERPVLGLAQVFDAAAQEGAVAASDPELLNTTWPATISWASNWAGGAANALDADYEWMYDDGWATSATTNVDCTAPIAPGCWGHRDNVLTGPQSTLVMGAGFALDVRGSTSFTELFVALPTPATAPSLYYTWAQAVAAGALA